MTHHIDGFSSRELLINGEKHLYFGGTAYLGLQKDKAFQGIFIENVIKYGTNYGASRKSNIRLSIYNEVEQHLKHWVGSQACITVSSGYLAGQLVAQTLQVEKHKLLYAPNTHSALMTDDSGSFESYSTLHAFLTDHLKQNPSKTPVVLLDSIDFSGNNYPAFEALRTLPLDKVILVVDDSHGIGVIGEHGNGIYQKLKHLGSQELLVCCSLGKGLGVQAGAIFGTENRINQLKNTAFFGGASPAMPAALATILGAQEIYAEKRRRLQQNINLFLDRLKYPKKFKFMKNHPAISFSDSGLTQFLTHNKIIVTDFNYPDEYSPTLSRIVLSAAHTKTDIVSLAKCIEMYYC
ncbi:aminotransferase class I/II-fold pyridoxal phosphate-dependent enzyme [uncultured Kriegella sp.]|uniref:aminotransferase class I/II-fold pyridoxal phosphate-dependent enzyme n=1 Tax=uncultured Kriegella sp. TaxID=1798910 RepID=UPI0030DD56DC|tara:strand:- start:75811 stop:76860 length:1050 start_codon:yes stop_codon:yes gene_type:complete